MSFGERFIVVDDIQSRSGLSDELRSRLLEVVEAEKSAGADRGLLVFELCEHTTDPGRFLTFEVWADRASFTEFHENHRPAALQRFLNEADRLITIPFENIASFWRFVSSPKPESAGTTDH